MLARTLTCSTWDILGLNIIQKGVWLYSWSRKVYTNLAVLGRLCPADTARLDAAGRMCENKNRFPLWGSEMLQGSSTSSSEMDASFQHVSIPCLDQLQSVGPWWRRACTGFWLQWISQNQKLLTDYAWFKTKIKTFWNYISSHESHESICSTC